MREAHHVLKLPVITEKSTFEKEKLQTLTFKVARDANKLEIKHAVEKIFKVKVASVRTATFHGKIRRQGRFSGRRPDWKKAYVTLKKGEKMFEFSEMV
ncbi:MAG: ribosomal protein [Acidobacteria bacterium]|jgi:large subunit ribosomal protein L23|nr:ribosomal protein [Acidobacteriota bacterium]